MLRIKRVYEPAEPSDGRRYLVERLWPRGIKKEALQMDAWLKEAAPSSALRTWYAHDVNKWEEFQKRYRAELESRPEAWKPDPGGRRAGQRDAALQRPRYGAQQRPRVESLPGAAQQEIILRHEP